MKTTLLFSIAFCALCVEPIHASLVSVDFANTSQLITDGFFDGQLTASSIDTETRVSNRHSLVMHVETVFDVKNDVELDSEIDRAPAMRTPSTLALTANSPGHNFTLSGATPRLDEFIRGSNATTPYRIFTANSASTVIFSKRARESVFVGGIEPGQDRRQYLSRMRKPSDS